MKKFIIILTLCCTFVSFGGNSSLLLKSVVIPGMGQLSAGKGKLNSKNSLKGLGIMTGFIVTLHQTISSISRMNSYARQTQYYSTLKTVTYNDELENISKWEDASSNYDKSKTSATIFGALAGLFYIGGVLDAFLFTSEEKSKTSGVSFKNRTALAIGSVNGNPLLSVKYKF